MIELLGQEELPVDSGIPRFGCFFMDMLAPAQLVYQVPFSAAKILTILDECRSIRWWNWEKEQHHIVDYGPAERYPYGKVFNCYLWDPGAVMDRACQWIAPQVHGWQMRDQNSWYPWAPMSRRYWSFIVKQILRPAGFHYDLHDAAHQLVYNPLPRLEGPYTGHWEGFAIGEVA
jgi:hypothetical protein